MHDNGEGGDRNVAGKRTRSTALDPPSAGGVIERSIISNMSKEEKRSLVHDVARSKLDSPEFLRSWSRRDILELLCLEMGKERKYTGLTKHKLIEHLLRIVSQKDQPELKEPAPPSSPAPTAAAPPKRQRKCGRPSRHPIEKEKERFCENLACQAAMASGDAFCKRCSCCICRKFDENKDPSLWLVCEADNGSCAISCHLECALREKKSGIAEGGQTKEKLDGEFYCVSCGKVNDLLGCWRKQLVIAKDARRVDILCYRVSLAHKLLNGTEKFQNLHSLVDLAAKKLEQEVGTLRAIPARMARGIVNRLSSGAEIQKLCSAALSLLPQSPKTQPLSLGDESDNSAKYGNGGDKEEEDEEPSSTIQTDSQKDSSNSTAAGKESAPDAAVTAVTAATAAVPPETPAKNVREKKVGRAEAADEEGKSYELCVKMIRWLECEGYMESGFRVKFLTWFSLRATAAERRVVKVFVDAMADDPSSLAGQIVDTFSEAVHRKPLQSTVSGFCTRLWH